MRYTKKDYFVKVCIVSAVTTLKRAVCLPVCLSVWSVYFSVCLCMSVRLSVYRSVFVETIIVVSTK